MSLVQIISNCWCRVLEYQCYYVSGFRKTYYPSHELNEILSIMVMDDIVSTTCGGCICRVWVLVRRMHPPPTFLWVYFSCVLRVEGGCRVMVHPPHTTESDASSHDIVLDTFIIVVMDASNTWRATGCDACILKILDVIITWMQTSRNTNTKSEYSYAQCLK